MRLRKAKIRPMLLVVTALFSGVAFFQGSTAALTQEATPAPSTCPTGFVGGFAEPRLFYPAPGATAVPVNAGQIIVYGIAQGTFALVVPSASPIAIGPIESIPSAMPTALPARSSPSLYHAIPVPTLSPGITYTVVFSAIALPCGPRQRSGPIGSFGT